MTDANSSTEFEIFDLQLQLVDEQALLSGIVVEHAFDANVTVDGRLAHLHVQSNLQINRFAGTDGTGGYAEIGDLETLILARVDPAQIGVIDVQAADSESHCCPAFGPTARTRRCRP